MTPRSTPAFDWTRLQHIVLVVLALTATYSFARGQSYDDLIAQAKQAQVQKDAARVLEIAMTAMRADAQRFEAPFLASAATIEFGQADSALRYAQRALFLAPFDKQAALATLVARFTEARDALPAAATLDSTNRAVRIQGLKQAAAIARETSELASTRLLTARNTIAQATSQMAKLREEQAFTKRPERVAELEAALAAAQKLQDESVRSVEVAAGVQSASQADAVALDREVATIASLPQKSAAPSAPVTNSLGTPGTGGTTSGQDHPSGVAGQREAALAAIDRWLQVAPGDGGLKALRSAFAASTTMDRLSAFDRQKLTLAASKLRDAADDTRQRFPLLRELLEKTQSAARAHALEMDLWIAQGRAAVELAKYDEAWEAGAALRALGGAQSNEAPTVEVLALIDSLGLLTDSLAGSQAAQHRLAETTKLLKLQAWNGVWEISLSAQLKYEGAVASGYEAPISGVDDKYKFPVTVDKRIEARRSAKLSVSAEAKDSVNRIRLATTSDIEDTTTCNWTDFKFLNRSDVYKERGEIPGKRVWSRSGNGQKGELVNTVKGFELSDDGLLLTLLYEAQSETTGSLPTAREFWFYLDAANNRVFCLNERPKDTGIFNPSYLESLSRADTIVNDSQAWGGKRLVIHMLTKVQ